MRDLMTGMAVGCAILLSVSGATAATAQTIQNFDSGWYQNNGFTAGVSNINVGLSNLNGAIYNNYLAFSLAGLASQNITSATLTFYGGNGVNTSSTSETLGLFDYKGSINALLSDQSSTSVFTDLGNGNSYGTAAVAAGAISQFTVTLTAAAIADLNLAAHSTDTRFVVGGSLQSVSGPFANEQLFAIFGPQAALMPAAQLNLVTSPVPEAATWAMLLTGFGLMGFAMRRKPIARIRFA